MATKVVPNPSLTDLAEFYNVNLPTVFEEDIMTTKLRLIEAIQARLAFYCVNWHTGKVTTVIFGRLVGETEVMVEGFVGIKQDLPVIYKHFRSMWPNILKLTGYRRNKTRKLDFPTKFLDRKLL